MLVSELIEAAHVAYKGNLRVPAEGTTKYSVYLSIANRKQREWANDPTVDWASLYSDESVGTVSGSSREYDLPIEVVRPSDFIYLEIDGVMHPYNVVPPREIDRTSRRQAVSVIGKTLRFSYDIADNLNGANIIVPAFYMPDALEDPTDEVAVDNPDWLVYALAAELARNDYSKDDQYPNLAGMANDLYEKMRLANEEVSYLQSSTVPIVTEIMGV